jgi:hypothetical protein
MLSLCSRLTASVMAANRELKAAPEFATLMIGVPTEPALESLNFVLRA